METTPGQIVVLNGAPRSGKSSIVTAFQELMDGPWMNLGVDVYVRHITPERYRPGLGLRPGERDHPVGALVPLFYAALYESVAAHRRLGLSVIVDVGHHDAAILSDCARRIAGLPAIFVGVRCPVEVIMDRRNAGQEGREGQYVTGPRAEAPTPVLLWQERIHVPGIYDVDVDTSILTPDECATAIRRRLDAGPGTAFPELAKLG